MRHMAEIEEVWFRGYGSVSFRTFTSASPCMLPSGQGTLVAPQAHGESPIPKISISKELSCFGRLRPKISAQTYFFPLNIVGSHWPTPAASSHLSEPPNGLKQLKRGSQ